jgi:hypothetical protein
MVLSLSREVTSTEPAIESRLRVRALGRHVYHSHQKQAELEIIAYSVHLVKSVLQVFQRLSRSPRALGPFPVVCGPRSCFPLRIPARYEGHRCMEYLQSTLIVYSNAEGKW